MKTRNLSVYLYGFFSTCIVLDEEFESKSHFGTFLLVRPHEKLLGLLGLGLGLTLMLTLTLIALTIIFRGCGLTGKYPHTFLLVRPTRF